MREALLALEGEHDFSAFRAAECQARSPVRRMYRAAVRQQGPLFTFEFRADGFLHHMIRNIVGSVVRVGRGRETPGWLGQVLAGRDRARAAPTFSPAGLYLAEVAYPPGRVPALPGPRASVAGPFPAFTRPATPVFSAAPAAGTIEGAAA
jgi:tRNA pseudouridine38-40 synthase